MTFSSLKVLAGACFALLCASCGVATNPETGPTIPALTGKLHGDYTRIQGSWVVTRDETRGGSTHREGAVFHYEGNRNWVNGDKGSEWFAINETASPKQIDFYDHKSPTIRGIYKIEGSRLTLCTADPGQPRPTEFKTSLRTGDILTELRKR